MNRFKVAAAALAAGLLAFAGSSHAVEVAVDAGLEDAGANGFPIDPGPGPLDPGWVGFSNGNFVGTTTDNPFDGTYAGQLTTANPASSSVLKNGNVGIGVAAPDSEVTISFWARGSAAEGGVAFAEFFSEIAGGGTSKSEILGGGPLAITSDWSLFEFVTTTGSDVSGGVTLQFAAVSGGANGSFSELFVDNISIDVAAIPVPAAVWLFGSALGFLGVRRRKAA